MKAKLLFHDKRVFQDHSMIEMKAWQILRTPRTPQGVKYSLVYINSQGRRVLGYDNAEGKGHHRHHGGIETVVEFMSLEDLVEEFWGEVRVLKGEKP